MDKIKKIVTSKYFVISLLIIVLTLSVLFYIYTNKPAELVNTPSLYKVQEGTELKEFAVTEFFPNINIIETVGNNYIFRVTFSDTVAENSVKVTVVPDKELRITRDNKHDNQIWIEPAGGWDLETSYILTVAEAYSINEVRLIEPYTHEFIIKPGEVPNVY